MTSIWIDHQAGKLGATPAAGLDVTPDWEVPSTAAMVELHKAHLAGCAAPPHGEMWAARPRSWTQLTGAASDDVRSQVHSAQPQRTRRTTGFEPKATYGR